jgi:3-hydroxymyristoyl/3-hydroxydecanoyl-(acyl carrier protein) dehydratase
MIDCLLVRGSRECTVRKVITCDETLPRAGGALAPGWYPESLVIEAMVQAALPLMGEPERGAPVRETGDRLPEAGSVGGVPGLLAAMDGVRFHRRVAPGDVLRITTSIWTRLGGLVRVTSRVVLEDGGDPVAEGEFTISTGPIGPAAPRPDGPGGAA